MARITHDIKIAAERPAWWKRLPGIRHARWLARVAEIEIAAREDVAAGQMPPPVDVLALQAIRRGAA